MGPDGKLTPEEAKEAVAIGRELAHSREYEAAIHSVGMTETAPKWDELSDFQRETIREENRRYWKSMQDFGQLIAEGKIDEALEFKI
jgi:hypothetical protein